MAAKQVKNEFSSPWNNSDIVLVVDDKELHVHKWILTMQSPVFKAMFVDDFKEASQDKIPLEDKDFKSMVQFLEILYPASMFEEAAVPLDTESRLSIMALADEYQCVSLIKKCINEVKVAPENVLQFLPYAVKYHQSALPKMFEVINWSTPASELEKLLPKLEGKDVSTSNQMLLNKCDFLESKVVEMHLVIVCLVGDLLKQRNVFNRKKKSKGMKEWEKLLLFENIPSTVADTRCRHAIKIEEISKTKKCSKCKTKYKETFIAPIPCCAKAAIPCCAEADCAEFVFNLMLEGCNVATAVEEQNEKRMK